VSNIHQQPLDSRLLSAMKRLRLENINLQRQVRALQTDLAEATSQAHQHEFRNRELESQLANTQKQLHLQMDAQKSLDQLESARAQWDAQRSALNALTQQQHLELLELRALLQQREEELLQLQHVNQAGTQELERVKHQARQVIVQHYQAMKTAQEQAQQAFEEVRRNRSQLEAIRAPISGRRKVLPPRSLRPIGNLQPNQTGTN